MSEALHRDPEEYLKQKLNFYCKELGGVWEVESVILDPSGNCMKTGLQYWIKLVTYPGSPPEVKYAEIFIPFHWVESNIDLLIKIIQDYFLFEFVDRVDRPQPGLGPFYKICHGSSGDESAA